MAVKFTPTTVALLMAASLTILSNATISPALPQIAAAFRDNPDAELLTRLLVTAPALFVAVLAPVAGIVVDRVGRKPVLLLGTLIYGIAGAGGLYLASLEAIFVSRLFLGAGVALIMTAQSALIGDLFEGPDRATFMGYQIAATNFGGFAAISLAGFLATFSFRFPFAIYALALLMLPYFWRVFAAAPQARGQAPTSSTAEPQPWILPLSGLSLLAFLSMAVFYIMPTQFPFYLQDVLGSDPAVAGLMLGLLTLAGGVGALVSGKARERAGPLWSMVAGQTIIALGFASVAYGEALIFQALGAALIGAGFAAVLPSIIAWMFTFIPPARRGAASGIMTMAIFLGQFASPLLSQPIIAQASFPVLFWTAAAIFVAKAVILAGLTRLPALRQSPL
ncbi:MFS transporter [Pararhodobacter marinus]|uniref:MFS transporter n=1 Tax=Pararhodobacter marinus TaxID=2184063 RepID=UPI0035175340